jgi:hypothetical protein
MYPITTTTPAEGQPPCSLYISSAASAPISCSFNEIQVPAADSDVPFPGVASRTASPAKNPASASLILSLTSLYEFSIDGIVALLQQTLIIFGYSFLFIFFLKEKKSPEFFYLLIINFFFFLAFLVRVDAIIHLILFNLFIFLYFKNNFYFFFKTILLFILIFSS